MFTVLKGTNMVKEMDSSPVIVLEEDCLIPRDFSKSMIGRVKMLGHYHTLRQCKLFRDKCERGSWFSVLRQASHDFTPEGRIAWVDVEGIPFKFWSGKTFKKIATKWGELLDVDDHDEMSFHSKRNAFNRKIVPTYVKTLNLFSKVKCNLFRAMKLPEVYRVIRRREDDDHYEQEFISSEQSDLGLHIDGEDNVLLSFTPSMEKNGSKSKDDQVQNISDNQLNGDNESVHQVEREDNRNSDGAKTNSTGSRKFKMSEIPRTGGSILSVMEEIVKVGLAQKAKKDWVKELCNKNKVSFVGLQETKMESIDLLSVRLCWGNVNFDYVHSDSIGNSGGILCIWDPNSFRKDSVTVSDYFVIVRGVWIKSGMDILIVVVYAPHDVRDKRLLWDYLSHVSNQWAGEVVMMGDFNEVRYKSDRFGSNFNAHGADIFNNFIIINAGLEEVPLDSWKDAPGDDSNAMRNLCGKFEFSSENPSLGVKQEFFQHFRNRFDKPPDQNAHIDMPFPNSLSTDQQKDLECMVSKEENPDANMVKDFRPISLIGSIYKIIAKILTNRLVGVLGDIVNEVQSTFISERQILDGPFILNEIMQWCRRRKKQSLIFKVDFEKAYDSVRWDFLDDILVKFSFGIKWRGWIQNCLNSSKGSILVNGSPTEEF
ncbi:RNA-directed DNA polymerase, eukaryota, reverse transcriptase zinc-binding domain protein [Tanacetum coccineum]